MWGGVPHPSVGFPTFGIPAFGIPVFGIPDFGILAFGIPTFRILVEFRQPLNQTPFRLPTKPGLKQPGLGTSMCVCGWMCSSVGCNALATTVSVRLSAVPQFIGWHVALSAGPSSMHASWRSWASRRRGRSVTSTSLEKNVLLVASCICTLEEGWCCESGCLV